MDGRVETWEGRATRSGMMGLRVMIGRGTFGVVFR